MGFLKKRLTLDSNADKVTVCGCGKVSRTPIQRVQRHRRKLVTGKIIASQYRAYWP